MRVPSRTASVLLLLLLPSLAGCASSRPAPERERVFLTDASRLTWTGKTVDQVLQVFGRPSSRTPDPDGGTVLTYEDIVGIGDTPQRRAGASSADPASPEPRTTVGTDTSGRAGVSVSSGPEPTATAPRDRTVATELKARFWVDEQGKVTRFWFSPELYRKGIPSPPSP
jgi:hypothetical protein